MIQRLIHRFLLRRHFWRYATFSEVAELYASRLMRLFALKIISVFTSIYLYQSGFELSFIAFFWLGFYVLKVIFAWPGAKIIAAVGPKHATLFSNIISAAAMVFLPFTNHPEFGLIALGLWCALQACSGSMNDLAYLVDFSKVKNIDHAGKEIGYMTIIEKVATGVSPLIGGLLAFWSGPEVVMIISALFFLSSAVPLFMTAEPMPTRRPLDFSGFPWRLTGRSLAAEFAIGIDIFTTLVAWSLFMVMVVFTSGSDRVYAEIGFVSSVTLVVSLFISYLFGRMIDRHRGRELLKAATIGNSVLHIIRGIVATPAGVITMNTLNEAATSGYNMPFMRGMFDTADRSGKRVEYLFLIEMAVNAGGALGAAVLGGLFLLFEGMMSLQIFFVFAGIMTLFIATPKFALYKK